MSIEVGSSVKVMRGAESLSEYANNLSKEVIKVDKRAGKAVCQWVEDGITKVAEFDLAMLVPFWTKVSMR